MKILITGGSGFIASHIVDRLLEIGHFVKILDVKTANELAEIIAAVGLAQNFAALRALATEGIQRGHMSLHARNVAIAAGAEGDQIDKVVEILVKEKQVRIVRAKEVLETLVE